MLYIPEQTVKSTVIVGIDPGSENLGFATIEFDFATYEIVATKAITYVGSKLMSKNTWLTEHHGERVGRIACLKEIVIERLQELDPILVVCESPFYNPRRPGAYGVLVEVMLALKEATREYDPWRVLNMIDPPTVKKSVGAKGNAGKEDVLQAVLNLPGLNYQGNVPLSDLDEHSIDAIAVAYSKYKELFLDK